MSMTARSIAGFLLVAAAAVWAEPARFLGFGAGVLWPLGAEAAGALAPRPTAAVEAGVRPLASVEGLDVALSASVASLESAGGDLFESEYSLTLAPAGLRARYSLPMGGVFAAATAGGGMALLVRHYPAAPGDTASYFTPWASAGVGAGLRLPRGPELLLTAGAQVLFFHERLLTSATIDLSARHWRDGRSAP